MTKNRLFKIIISIFIILTLIMIFSQTVSALGINMDSFKGKDDKSEATNKVANTIGTVINIIQIIGVGIAILMLVILGIKWVGESPSGKAQITKSIQYYIVGAIFIFSAIALLQIVKMFTQKNLVGEASDAYNRRTT